MGKKITARQFIHVMENNKCYQDPAWRKIGRQVFIVERIHYDDGTSEKVFTHIEQPTIKFHISKIEHALNRPRFSVPFEECDEYEVPVDQVARFVAKETDQMDFFQFAQGRDRKRVLLHPDVHGADVNLSDHYIRRYFEEHGELAATDKAITLGFFDIEVDGSDLDEFPDEDVAPAPVNLINYFDSETRMMYVFLDPINQHGEYYHVDAERFANDRDFREGVRYQMFLFNNWSSFREEKWFTLEEDQELPTMEQIVECGIRLNAMPEAERKEFISTKLRCLDVKVAICSGEFDLIRKFLNFVVNVRKPDFCTAWNMKFDIKTLINRLIRLGHNPEVYFTPRDFGDFGQIDYYTDEFNEKPTDKKDIFSCVGYTAWVDQMLVFASLRKTAGVRPSYSLENIISDELNEHKFDLAGAGGIKDAPYVNYICFLIYGGLDVAPMYSLEKSINDIDMIYRISMMTKSRVHKNMTKTTILRNFACEFFYQQGRALSVNRNMFNVKDPNQEKFLGAIVADPTLMDFVGEQIDGLHSNRVFKSVIDFDAKSMYPSIDRWGNIDPESLIGVMYLPPTDPGDPPARFNGFSQDWVTNDKYIIGTKYFGLMSVDETVVLLQTKGLGTPNLDTSLTSVSKALRSPNV